MRAAELQETPRRKKRKVPLSKIIIYIILSVWTLGTVYPFLWVVNSSFKTTTQIMNDSFSPVVKPILNNYINAFESQNILRSYGNSLIISGSVTVIVMLLAAMVAFALTRYRFRGRQLVYALIIGSLMFPVFSTIIPVFKIVFKLGLVSRPLGVILPQVAGNLSFAIIVMMGYLKDIPHDFEEAAYMEGCNVWQIFTKIILPLSKPALATVAIFTFLWSYNDLFTQLIIMRDPKSFPICTLLNEISSKYGTDFGLMAASVTLIVIPVLIVYIFLQKNIIKGLTAGAIKG